ncbi:MAG: valine--tRNA ligase [Candidatus Buchananbacteria bacterium]|nr:valine--tRNA ligase [Candidatus Buchananbacteria bacterium]
MSETELPKSYTASEHEDRIYEAWERSGYFNPDKLPGERTEPYTVILPPPNATGTLHTGHAMYVVEDIAIRFERLRGKRALWLPGTDHAAIATNAKVEKQLNKEGLTRQEIGREAFVQRIETFIKGSQGTINNQLRKLGFSLDWSREAYTLDETRSYAVRYAFKQMYDLGLIYRGYRVVNWDPIAKTTIADDEIVYKEVSGKLYTFKYSKDFPIPVATTRPETKLGDTAVAVHPEGKWKEFIGQTFEVADFAGAKLTIQIVGDEAVDESFGTGAVGVTPAHSAIDYEIAQRHQLPLVEVINEEAKIIETASTLVGGLPVLEAREKIVAWIKDQGLLMSEEDMVQNLSLSERTEAVIEPLPKRQWFVNVNKEFPYTQSVDDPIDGFKDGQLVTLKQLMQHVVRSGQIKILPERFSKIYFNWVDNLRDWNISRQIWFGHQVPVWYRGDEMVVGVEAPAGTDWQQDPDVLDTWFSSGLWTFSTLGWPNEHSEDLQRFHPTDMLDTGYDILPFWVSKMIMLSTGLLGEVPFKTVYLHGLIRDEQGRKMSKSLENIIDPLDIIPEYGADALRLALAIGSTPGNDKNLGMERITFQRNFVNKLWNISRFILTSVNEVKLITEAPKAQTLTDEWLLNNLNTVVAQVTKHLEQYNFSAAAEILQEFTWSDFADWYLEVSKIEKDKDEILLYTLQTLLKLWHPFIPYVTEVIWEQLNAEDLLLVAPWPLAQETNIQVSDFETVKELITVIRTLKSEQKIAPSVMVPVQIVAGDKQSLIEAQMAVINKLARCEISMVAALPEGGIGTSMAGIALKLDTSAILDPEAERVRLEKEIAELEAYIKKVEAKLANAEFVANAPEAVVATERQKLSDSQSKLALLRQQVV